ncbi:GIY-YIG nuclease family protein [Leptolyngbya cf. ectocarpi LEGE 11479]|uniref:GIY-YIG nuclease family protein n=1 Tax=Leptolyngbya cf. ectocarpi LEGE 11479 TaxID=1828722 RepID=A0A928ZT47_LEPEC|nr:GIY-YIG nuclease family protein [Leptolyngbya ectocarpi]MBE9066371.1 GIY-YIG nuclease family protein [Leptolyngbya cf. ectocarpi LEGE 11479]
MADSLPSLASLDMQPYLVDGELPSGLAGKVGIYAIFDQAESLQYVGYSRDISVGLTQHLVRCPQQCHWFKVYTVARPSRTLLDEIRNAWLSEYGSVPPGNSDQQLMWEKPIDAKVFMTDTERDAIANAEPADTNKLLKKLARRVEADVKASVAARGAQIPIKFNPKLKEQGVLALK